MPYSQLVTSFNAGELSPFLDAQVAMEKYAAGCRKMENFIPLPYGGVMRRPGTEYLGGAKNNNKRCRLIPFVFSDTTRYVIELGETYARFWYGGLGSVVGGETPQEVTTPYAEIDLREVQFTQINDVMYFAHAKFPPQRLRRTLVDGALTFVWDETPFNWPAFLDDNLTSGAITPSATTGNISLAYTPVGSESLFTLAHVGAYFKIGYNRGNSTVSKAFDANGTSSTLAVLGGWNLSTVGTWAGTLAVERSYDNGSTWEVIQTYTVSSDRNITAGGNQLKKALLRINFTNRTVGTAPNDRALLAASDPVNWGIVKITSLGSANGWLTKINVTNGGTGYGIAPAVTFSGGGGSGAMAACVMKSVPALGTLKPGNTLAVDYIIITNPGSGYTSAPTVTIQSPQEAGGLNPDFVTTKIRATATATRTYASNTANATVIETLGGTTATTIWAEGAFSNVQGFPRAIEAHEGRIFYGGTASKPQSVWATRLDDFENFRTGVSADDGLFFTAASRTTNLIQWMRSKDGLLHVGKVDGEGYVGAASDQEVISPSSVVWRDTTKFGSDYLPAVVFGDSLLFVQRQGRKVRELAFSNERQAYGGSDLTLLAEHVTAGKVLERATQTSPDGILWAVRGDGQLIGMTYERDQGVFAWHRHTTRGQFESVCTIPGDNGDEVWVVAQRRVGAPGFEATKRFIERFKVDWRETFEDTRISDWWYLDCAKQRKYDGSPTTAFDDGDWLHLAGDTVRVLVDGADAGNAEVDDQGIISVPFAGLSAVAGFAYLSTLQPMKFHAATRAGTSRNMKSQVTNLSVQILKSLGGEFSTDNGATWDKLIYRDAADSLDDAPAPFTGTITDLCAGGYTSEGADVSIRTSAPMPLTIIAIIPEWGPTGSNL